MEKTRFPRFVSAFLCVVLIAAMALTFTGCDDTSTPPIDQSPDNPPTVMGQGVTTFEFHIVDRAGATTRYEIHTNEITVGAALSELELIAGEESHYGLYVKSVGGVPLDYERDGAYWAFYCGDTLAPDGVDNTPIVHGVVYRFVAKEA